MDVKTKNSSQLQKMKILLKNVIVQLLKSCLTFCDHMDCSLPGFSVHGFLRQEYWSGLPFLSPGDLPDPGIKPGSLVLQADSLLFEPPGKLKYEAWLKVIISSTVEKDTIELYLHSSFQLLYIRAVHWLQSFFSLLVVAKQAIFWKASWKAFQFLITYNSSLPSSLFHAR